MASAVVARQPNVLPSCLIAAEKCLSELTKQGMPLNTHQLDRIVKIVQRLLEASLENFCSLSREDALSLSAHKIHIFIDRQNNQADIYLRQRKSPNLQTGGSKGFLPASRLKLTFSPGSIDYKVSQAACLKMRFNRQSNETVLADLSQEVELLKKYKGQPHFCQIINSQEYKGRHIGNCVKKIVMYQKLYPYDLISAMPIIQKLPEREKEHVILKILHDTATALSKFHRDGLTHCDIKPENIFLSNEFEAFIGDFNLSLTTEYLSQNPETFRGTPQVFAPEMINNFFLPRDPLWSSFRTGPASDIWALGCTLSFLFTENYPQWSYFIEALCVVNALIAPGLTSEIKDSEVKRIYKPFNTRIEDLELRLKIHNQELEQITKEDSRKFSNCFNEDSSNQVVRDTIDLTNSIKITIKEIVESRNLLDSEKQSLRCWVHVKFNPHLRKISQELLRILNETWEQLNVSYEPKLQLCQSLIQQMLQQLPENRITAQGILDNLMRATATSQTTPSFQSSPITAAAAAALNPSSFPLGPRTADKSNCTVA